VTFDTSLESLCESIIKIRIHYCQGENEPDAKPSNQVEIDLDKPSSKKKRDTFKFKTYSAKDDVFEVIAKKIQEEGLAPIEERKESKNMLKNQSERLQDKANNLKQLRNIRHQSVLNSADLVRRDFIKSVLNHRLGTQNKIDSHGRERLGEIYMTVDRLLNEVKTKNKSVDSNRLQNLN